MEPIFEQFFCCPMCRGLFPILEEVRAHFLTCSGLIADSSASLFAIPKASTDIEEEPLETITLPDHSYFVNNEGNDHCEQISVIPLAEDEVKEIEQKIEICGSQTIVKLEEANIAEGATIADQRAEDAVTKEEAMQEGDTSAEFVEEKSAKEETQLEEEDKANLRLIDGVKKCVAKDKRLKRLDTVREWTEKYKDYAKEVKNAKGQSQVEYHCPICAKVAKKVGFFNRHMIQCHPSECNENGAYLWKCEFCEFSTDSKAKFNQHSYRHNKKVMCDVCSMRFASKRDLQIHSFVHTGERPYQCDQCEFSTRFQHAFKAHQRKHSGEMLRCDVAGCDFETAYQWALKCHKNSRHDRSLFYQCDMCAFTSTNRSSLIRHQKVHLGIREYSCMVCSYDAVSKHDILRHMRSHNKEKIYYCDRCNFATSYCSGLRIHLMQHLKVKPFQCSVCETTAITKQKILQHIKAKHPDTDADAINLGVKLDIDFSQFKRKAAECFIVKNEEVKSEVEMPENLMVENSNDFQEVDDSNVI